LNKQTSFSAAIFSVLPGGVFSNFKLPAIWKYLHSLQRTPFGPFPLTMTSLPYCYFMLHPRMTKPLGRISHSTPLCVLS